MSAATVQQPLGDVAQQTKGATDQTVAQGQEAVDNGSQTASQAAEQTGEKADVSAVKDATEEAQQAGDKATSEATKDADGNDEAQQKQDAELANKISNLVEKCIDKIKPTLKMITETLDKADRDRQNGELDEDTLVQQVKPLLESATNTLQECHGGIKGLDPDGSLSKRAQSHTADRKASPEEYRLSDLLKELTESVEKTIEEGKRRIQDMPKAKKDLGPLFEVLGDPLFQIISAVGLLLNGVLGLLKNLLGGLGLGGIIDNITGALGLDKILKGMGFGNILGGK